MRTLAIVGGIIIGLIVISGVAGAVSGSDNTGETVRAQSWANDVCGTVGAWEGQLKDIREQLRRNNWAARRSDGSTGDSNEQVTTIRGAVRRMVFATQQSLQRGLKRAGIPDATNGVAAAAVMRAWAKRTELNLRVAKAQVRQRPTSVAEAFASLAPPVTALARSAVDGRVALRKVAALDPELEDAINRSGKCRRLMRNPA